MLGFIAAVHALERLASFLAGFEVGEASASVRGESRLRGRRFKIPSQRFANLGPRERPIEVIAFGWLCRRDSRASERATQWRRSE